MRLPAGYPEMLACTLTWGTLGVVRRHLDLSSGVVVFFRLALGALVVIAWLALRGRLGELRPSARPVLLVCAGLILGVHWVTEFEAFRRLDVAAAVLIVFIGPVLAALLAPVFLGERLRAVVVVALLVAVTGIVLISVPGIDRLDALGLASAVVSGLLFAALLLVGKILTESYSSPALVVWQLTVGAVVVSPFLADARADAIADGWALLALLGFVYTGVLGILYFRALRALEAQRFGVIAYLEPASAVFFAWLLLSETPHPLTAVGGALVVVAGIVTVLSERTPVAPTGIPEPPPEKR